MQNRVSEAVYKNITYKVRQHTMFPSRTNGASSSQSSSNYHNETSDSNQNWQVSLDNISPMSAKSQPLFAKSDVGARPLYQQALTKTWSEGVIAPLTMEQIGRIAPQDPKEANQYKQGALKSYQRSDPNASLGRLATRHNNTSVLRPELNITGDTISARRQEMADAKLAERRRTNAERYGNSPFVDLSRRNRIEREFEPLRQYRDQRRQPTHPRDPFFG